MVLLYSATFSPCAHIELLAHPWNTFGWQQEHLHILCTRVCHAWNDGGLVGSHACKHLFTPSPLQGTLAHVKLAAFRHKCTRDKSAHAT